MKIVLCIFAAVLILELLAALWIIVRQQRWIEQLLERLMDLSKNSKEAEEEDPADWWKKKEEKIQNG